MFTFSDRITDENLEKINSVKSGATCDTRTKIIQLEEDRIIQCYPRGTRAAEISGGESGRTGDGYFRTPYWSA